VADPVRVETKSDGKVAPYFSERAYVSGITDGGADRLFDLYTIICHLDRCLCMDQN